MKRLWLTLGIWGLLGAQAQVAYDQAVSLRVARFSEMVRIQMAAMVIEPSEELVEAMGSNSQLFMGSLYGLDKSLGRKLETALAQVQQLARENKTQRLSGLGPRINWLLDQTQRTLIPKPIRQDPAFQAALIAQLLNLEEGVAEAYEEAAQGEEEAYPLAWAGLQRVNVLWKQLRPKLSNGEAIQKTHEALTKLGNLIATPQAPERYSDPEDAEQAALDGAFALEQATKPLLLQDLGKALNLSRQNALQACKAAENKRWGLATEWASAANIYYQQHLAATLQTLAPQTHSPLVESLEGLRENFQTDQLGLEPCRQLPKLFAQAGEFLK